MLRYLHEKQFDIICIQETHAFKACEKRWKLEWGGRIFFANGTSSSRGVCILCKKNLRLKMIFLDKDPEGRFLILDATINDIEYLIVNVYGANFDHPAFYTDLFKRVQSFNIDYKLLFGDFNLALDIDYDIDPLKNGPKRLKKSAELLREFLAESDLVDIWRINNPNKFRLTWHSGDRKSRIDYIFLPHALIQLVNTVDILVSYNSDHSIPYLHLLQDNNSRGRGFWKFNNSLLYEKQFVDIINNLITVELDNYEFDSHKEKWEYIKMKIHGECIVYSANKRKEQKKRLEECESKLKQYEEGLIDDNHYNQYELTELFKTFHEIHAERTRAAMIRTKSEWLLGGNKPSSYFLNLEKHNYNKKTIKRLQDESGNFIEDPNEILEFEQHFFQALKTSHFDQEYIDTTYLDTIDLPTVNRADYDFLESDLTKAEISKAVKDLKHGKCPGIDGLTAEFYQFFWSKLSDFLYALYLEIIQDEFLNDSASLGLISLLEKPEKNLLFLPNWRPLTLLTIDYKILAKALANRILPILLYLIHPQQSGFIRGRYIAENILNLTSVIEYCLVHSVNALVLSLDVQKAFDKVEYPALWAIMNKFGFGPKFMSMV